MIKICFRATWTWRSHNIVNVVNATEWYTLRWWILYYLHFTSILIKGKTKEIIYYIHSGVTLLEGKEMDPVWVFSHFLSSQAVCSALGSGAFVPMVTNANCLQGAKGSAWGSEWSLKDRKKNVPLWRNCPQSCSATGEGPPLTGAQGWTLVSLALVLIPRV